LPHLRASAFRGDEAKSAIGFPGCGVSGFCLPNIHGGRMAEIEPEVNNCLFFMALQKEILDPYIEIITFFHSGPREILEITL
jgi:hypothetical protein